MLTAKDLFQKAELAAKKFVESARSIVFVDNLTILHGLGDCLDSCDAIVAKATQENDTVREKLTASRGTLPVVTFAVPPPSRSILPLASNTAHLSPIF